MVKQKTLVFYFLILVTFMLLPLPIKNALLIIESNNSDISNFNKKTLFSTDIAEGYRNFLFYRFFKKSLNGKQVIVGKDDFLFLGNNYASVIDKTQGLYQYKTEEIERWTDKLLYLQNWYQKKNIQFILVIAPNKHSIYNDKLPHKIIYKMGRTITDDITRIASSKNINILDLRNELRKNKKKYDNLLYLKTDTHWNGLGASIAYEKTIDYLNERYNKNYITPSYTYKKVSDSGKDLSKFLKIKSILPKNHEISIWFDFNIKQDICIGGIDKKTYNLDICKFEEDPIYSINNQPKYTINHRALNKEKVLIISDSFSRHNSQLYNKTFENIWKFHFKHLNGENLSEFVNIHKPDIVIYQVVERSLYNQKMVTELR